MLYARFPAQQTANVPLATPNGLFIVYIFIQIFAFSSFYLCNHGLFLLHVFIIKSTFPTCINKCTCHDGGCIMNSCLTDCHCRKGNCEMDACINNCYNGHEATPPLCVETEELDPYNRKQESGDNYNLTPTQVCQRDYATINASTPYICDKGIIYACCQGDADVLEHASVGLGICVKDLKMEVGIGGSAFAMLDNNDKGNGNNSEEGQDEHTPQHDDKKKHTIVGFVLSILLLLVIFFAFM